MAEMSMDEIRARTARQRCQLFLMLMQPTVQYDTTTEQGQELMRQHLQWQFNLEDRGVLLGAGPLNDGGSISSRGQYEQQVGSSGRMLTATGMSVLAVNSEEEAEAIARTEPFEVAGWRRHELVRWTMNEGAAWQLVRQLQGAAPKA